MQECYDGLKFQRNNKSPGCDGLSVEFYKTFWDDIGQKRVFSLNYAKQIGRLSMSQRCGVITLLHKKGER